MRSLIVVDINYFRYSTASIKQSIPAYMKRIRHPSVYQSPQFSTTQATHILSIFRNDIQDYSILCVFLIVVIKFLIVCLSSFARCLAPGIFLMSICSSSSATSIIVFSARFFSFSRSSSACNSCRLASSASTVSFFSGFLVISDIGI